MHQLLIPRLDLCTFYFPFPIWLPVTSANRACEGKVDCGGTGRCRFFIAWAFHSPSHKRVHCTWHSHSLAIAPSSFFTPGIVGITAEQVFHLSRAFFPPHKCGTSVCFGFLLSFGFSVLVLVRLFLPHLNNYFWCQIFLCVNKWYNSYFANWTSAGLRAKGH